MPTLGPALSLVLGVAATAVAAGVPGLVNGLLIARLGVPPFIGTLGMYGVARGVAYLLAGGTTVPVGNPILSWHRQRSAAGRADGRAAHRRRRCWCCTICCRRRGSASTPTRSAAIGRRRCGPASTCGASRSDLYILSALCAALGGILYAGRFSAGAAQAGEPLLLDSIAAVVIGGASLFGGSGTIVGTLIGALIVAVIQYGLVFINVEPFWQFVAVGVVIIISVLVDQSQKRLGGGRVDE